MDRRKFVSALGLGLGGLALAGCEQKDCPPVDGQAAAGAEPEKKKPEQQTYEWKMVTTWPKNYPGLGAGANRFAKRVEEMSAGRIKIKVYGKGAPRMDTGLMTWGMETLVPTVLNRKM